MKEWLEKVKTWSMENKKLAVAILAAVLFCFVLLSMYCPHEWTTATCIELSTCTKCGKTRGDLADHLWSAATCTEPQICSVCGTTMGDPLGHEWAAATCTEPETCSVCGVTRGGPLGHTVTTWLETVPSTCAQAGSHTGTCDVCGQTITEELPLLEHTPGEWQITTAATLSRNGTRVKLCTVCGATLEEESYSLSAEEKKQLYISQCNTYSYEQIARNPDEYEGELAKFRGKVIQVMESYGGYIMRVNITPLRWGWDDTIYVIYAGDSSDSRILEDDIVTMYGELKGTYTYTSIFGATITLPYFRATYVDIG